CPRYRTRCGTRSRPAGVERGRGRSGSPRATRCPPRCWRRSVSSRGTTRKTIRSSNLRAREDHKARIQRWGEGRRAPLRLGRAVRVTAPKGGARRQARLPGSATRAARGCHARREVPRKAGRWRHSRRRPPVHCSPHLEAGPALGEQALQCCREGGPVRDSHEAIKLLVEPVLHERADLIHFSIISRSLEQSASTTTHDVSFLSAVLLHDWLILRASALLLVTTRPTAEIG